MINSVGIAGQHTLEESGPNLKGQVLILATMAALVFYLGLAILAPMRPDPALVQSIAHDTVSQAIAVGNYTLTIYEDNSMELAWITEVAAASDTRQTGSWVNERSGFIGINR